MLLQKYLQWACMLLLTFVVGFAQTQAPGHQGAGNVHKSPHSVIPVSLAVRFDYGGSDEIYNCIAYSPDGQTLAVGGREGSVTLWEAKTGRPKVTLSVNSGLLALAFSPDSKTLATAGRDPVVRLWDVGTGRLVRSLPDHADNVFTLLFAPDGRLISTDGGGKERFWDIRTGKLEETRALPTNYPAQLVLAANGHILLTGYERQAQGGPEAKVWNLDSGQVLITCKVWNHEGVGLGVPLICMSKNGALLACTMREKPNNGRMVQVWKVKTGNPPVYLNSEALFPISFSPDGRSLVMQDGVYDVGTGKRQWPHTPIPNGSWLTGAYSPDGKILTVGRFDRSIAQFDAKGGRLLNTWNGVP